VRLHGLRVLVAGDDGLCAAARDLGGDATADAAGGPPDLVLSLARAPASPAPAGPCRFFHGVVRCHASGDDLIVWDGASRARVVAGGARIEVEVADATLGDPHRFSQVFLLVALVLALRWRGLFHLHAGALVAPGGRGVLVAGGAGAGKSTLTVALLEQGCDYLGDDAVLLRAGGGAASVLALPRPFHLGERTAAAFPRLRALLGAALAAGDKRRLDPAAAWPGRARLAMGPPALILLPEVAPAGPTTTEPVAPAEALGALLESSALVAIDALPGARAQLDALRRLVDGAPALRVRLGRDLLDRPELCAGLLAEPPGGFAAT
jgi:hypothetical protein